MYAQQLTFTEIQELIPHRGTMCMLHDVVSWDERSIRCTATSHRRDDNPLRQGGNLCNLAALEYAAQAIAVHGALSSIQTGRSFASSIYLTSLRNVTLAPGNMRGICGELLQICAMQVAIARTGGLYRFSIESAATIVASGTAMVTL